jgi:hypothetical protein
MVRHLAQSPEYKNFVDVGGMKGEILNKFIFCPGPLDLDKD